MFKFLKKVLFGAEKELEKKLEDQLEDELAKERAKGAKPAATPPAPPAPASPQHITAGVLDIPPQPLASRPAPPPAGSKERLPHSLPASKEQPVSAPERVVPPPPPSKENIPPPPQPALSPQPPAAPTGYKEAKRQGVLEEQMRKKETIEERIERELSQAVQTQKAIEKVVGDDTERVILPADKLEDLLWELELGLL